MYSQTCIKRPLKETCI